MYADAPSKQVKVRVRDRGVIVTADAERRAVRPEGMQAAIDAAVAACGEDGAGARVPRGPAVQRTSCASTPRGGRGTSPTRWRARWRKSCTRTRGLGTNREWIYMCIVYRTR